MKWHTTPAMTATINEYIITEVILRQELKNAEHYAPHPHYTYINFINTIFSTELLTLFIRPTHLFKLGKLPHQLKLFCLIFVWYLLIFYFICTFYLGLLIICCPRVPLITILFAFINFNFNFSFSSTFFYYIFFRKIFY